MSEPIIISIIAGTFSMLTALGVVLLNNKLSNIHKQINSRMDEFLRAQKMLGHAEGKAEEKAENTMKTDISIPAKIELNIKPGEESSS